MSELLKKSGLNLEGSSLLISNKMFASSVHCSYYSSVQLMLHLLHSEFKKTKKEIDSESKKPGSHHRIKNFYIQEIKKKNPTLARKFNKSVGTLKISRNKADYKDEEIKENIANKSLYLAKKINQLLEKTFQK